MAHRPNIYDLDLGKNAANHAPLTPLTFLAWTAEVYPQRLAVVHGSRRLTWSEVYARSRRLASALAARGVGVGDTVAVMLSNTLEMYEAHFGVPMTGAVRTTSRSSLITSQDEEANCSPPRLSPPLVQFRNAPLGDAAQGFGSHDPAPIAVPPSSAQSASVSCSHSGGSVCGSPSCSP